MINFGVPMNVNSAARESGYKVNRKNPARNTQKSSHKLAFQTSPRHVENCAIELASQSITTNKEETNKSDEDGFESRGASYRIYQVKYRKRSFEGEILYKNVCS